MQINKSPGAVETSLKLIDEFPSFGPESKVSAASPSENINIIMSEESTQASSPSSANTNKQVKSFQIDPSTNASQPIYANLILSLESKGPKSLVDLGEKNGDVVDKKTVQS